METKNYFPELQEEVYRRLDNYEIEAESNADMYAMWMHVRALMSLHLKAETGEGLVKGNRPITEDQYNHCIKYLDIILPEKEKEDKFKS